MFLELSGRFRSARFGMVVLAGWAIAFGGTTQASETRAGQLDRVIEDYAKAYPGAPGVAAAIIADDGKVQWSGATGRANRETGVPLTTKQQFRIASVTKLHTSAAIFVLSEQGKLDLNAGIARYVTPETTTVLRHYKYDPDAILVRHLLAHSSGIPDYAMSESFQNAVMGNPRRRWARAEQIEFALSHAAAIGAPGERFSYSDTGYIILGEIIERATGQSLDAALTKLLAFDTHGLRRTRMEVAGDVTSPSFAHAYMGEIDTAAIDPSFDLYGGGGLISTVDDLARFVRVAYRGGFFKSPATLSAALAIVPTQADEHPYALMGVPVTVGQRVCWGHFGFWSVFALYCPSDDIAIAGTLNVHAEGVAMRPLLESLVGAAATLRRR